MATLQRFNCFLHDLAQGKHNLATDDIRIALSNTAPDLAADTGFADITEISAGNGYVAGGFALPGQTLTQVTNQTRLSGADTAGVVAASGGNIGPFQYVIVYNNTEAGKALIQTADLGSPITVTDGTSRDLNLQSTNDALLTIG
ncbi:MAG: hypothetical protein KDK00_01960 [Rhodobacteraceae bacterium]|nr:hypothetical protein [Paracoccaceae bacterium]